MSALTVAAIQMTAGDNKESNLAKAETLIDTAIEKGAGFIVLPEYFNFCGDPKLHRQEAEPIPGPTVEMLTTRARANRVYILGGSIAESINGREKFFNTSVLIGPSGEIIAKYRKIHLFDVAIDQRVIMRESDVVEPGDKIVLAETEYGIIGLSICYDLRFPELYRALAVGGARIIFVPASFMLATGKDHWAPLLQARAIENQVFVVAADQIGPLPGSGVLRYGRSMIVDPWGTVLAQAADTETVITAELDFGYLSRVRKQVPSLAHRRPEVYVTDKLIQKVDDR